MTPIAIFAYNRPLYLQACLEAVARSQEHLGRELPLYIFCDAAGKEEDQKSVERTRAIARAWPKATVVEREENFHFRNITEGISQLCNTYGRAIIVEDDVLVAPDFLSYMTQAIEKYEDDPHVFMISAFMYFGAQPKNPSTFFLPHSFIWGWATWKRAWDHFSWRPEGWESFVKDKRRRHEFDYFGALKFSKMVEKTMQGQWNTWDAPWMLSMYLAGGLALYPHQSLVWNCGVGGGTHGGKKLEDPSEGGWEGYLHGDLTLEDFKSPRLPEFSFPEGVHCDKKAMRRLAVTFLKERMRKEPKKRFRRALQLVWLKMMASLQRR